MTLDVGTAASCCDGDVMARHAERSAGRAGNVLWLFGLGPDVSVPTTGWLRGLMHEDQLPPLPSPLA